MQVQQRAESSKAGRAALRAACTEPCPNQALALINQANWAVQAFPEKVPFASEA